MMPAKTPPVNEPAPPRALIADDSAGMRTYLRSILASAGFECVEATDGGAAFDAIMGGSFDLLLTDLEMPGMDGFQLLAALSLLPVSRGRPPIIVISALLDETLADRRPELRAASVLLAKPLQPQDLLKAVSRVLNRRVGCA